MVLFMHFEKRMKNLISFSIFFLTVSCFPTNIFGQVIYESAASFNLEKDFSVIERNGKLGISDNKGNEIIPPKFEKIRINKDQTLSGLPPREWQIIDGHNNYIHKFQYDSVSALSDDLLHVKSGQSEALADQKGNLITSMRPWRLYLLSNKYIVAEEDDKYGILNAGGKITIPIIYDTLFLSEDYVVGKLSEDKKPIAWHVIQFSGEMLFKKDCTAVGIGNQGYFSFLENKSWGFFNYEGDKIIPNQYDSVDPFINGKAIARYMNSDGVINRKGEWLLMPRKDSLQFLTSDIYVYRDKKTSGLTSASRGEIYSTTNEFIPINHGFLEKNSQGKFGLIDPEGKRLLTTEYEEISPLQNDTIYLFRKDNHWGILTKAGKIKLNLHNPIQEMYPMGDEFIGVKIDNKYGFVDINGDLRIANRYEAIGAFHEDMAAVKLLGKWGFVDRIERLNVQPLYDVVFPFENGCAIVAKQKKYGLVNTAGSEVLSLSYDSLYRTETGRYIIQNDNKIGLADKDGRILIYPKYNEIDDLDNGFVIIGRNKKYGLLTQNGISTIPLIYEKIIFNPFSNVFYVSNSPKWDKINIR